VVVAVTLGLWTVYGPTNSPLQQLVFGAEITDQVTVFAVGPLMNACPPGGHASQFGLEACDVLSREGRVTHLFADTVPTLTPVGPAMTPGDLQDLHDAAGLIEWAPSRDITPPAGISGVVQVLALRCDTNSGFLAVRVDGHRGVDFPFFDLDTPAYRCYLVTFSQGTAEQIRQLLTDNYFVGRGS
jgi:hypothetical protein